MEQFYKSSGLRASLATMMILLFTAFSSWATGLSGTFTIDPGSSASSTNYLTFASAVSDMTSGTRADGGTTNGPGVSGAVIFNVANGTFTEQISIGSITGASSSNTITFESNALDSSKVILKYASSASSTNDFTLRLNGAKYVTFKELTIQRTGAAAYASVVMIQGGTQYCSFLNNRVIGQYAASTAVQYNNGCFQTPNNASFPISGTSDNNNNTYQNNYIVHGMNGFLLAGSSGSTGTIISGNIIDSVGMACIFLGYQNGAVITNNTCYNRAFSGSHYAAYSIRLEYCNDAASAGMQITGNKFYNLANAGTCRSMYTYYDIASTYHTLLANNFFTVTGGSATTTCTGIVSQGLQNWDIVFNNFLVTSTVTSAAPIYWNYYGYSGNTIENNNLINTGGGYAYYVSYPGDISYEDYNSYYATGTNIAYFYYTNYTTFSSFQSGASTWSSSFDANSINVNPTYNSTTDLHCSGIGVYHKGTPFTGVSTDIDGTTRNSSTPTIGAHEFTPAPDDAGVSAITAPSGSFCTGAQSVQVTLINAGTNTLSSATISWTVGGVAQTPYSWTGSVGSGSVSSAITLGTYTFTSSPILVKAWSESPNGTTDGNPNNDTSSGNIGTGLSGTYTIGGVSPNYATISAAITDAYAKGLCGAVTFNIANGTYGENLSFSGPISGASSTNTVTFTSASGDSSKVIIASNEPNYYGGIVSFINNASWITLSKVTVKAIGTTNYGTSIFMGGANHNTVTNCQLLGRSNSGAYSDYGVYLYYYNGSGYVNNNFNTISNNSIRKSTWGIYEYGYNYSSGNYNYDNAYTGNIIDSNYEYGIYTYYSHNTHINGNIVRNTNYQYGYPLSIWYGDSIQVLANKVYNNGTYQYGGITLYYNTNTSSQHGLVANNFVTGNSNSSNYYGNGIYMYGNQYVDVVYNSVNIIGNQTGSFAYNDNDNSTGYNTLKNNNFVNVAGGQAGNIFSAYVASSNYNNWYTTGTNLITYNYSTYSNLSSYQSASGYDANSVSANPSYASSTDLHAYGAAINNKGTTFSGVTTDIDGQTRSGSTPDIGADEFTPAAYDAGVTAIINPTGNYCPGTTTVSATVKNFGTATLTSLNVSWSVNGSAQTPLAWTGTLASGATMNVNVGTYTFTGSSVSVKIETDAPNGTTDPNNGNDTSLVSGLTQGLSGTLTIGGVSPNYSTFAAAVSAVSAGGVCGNLIFQVANGSYNEYLNIGSFPTSPTKTVTFQGNTLDSTKVVLWYSSNIYVNNGYLIQMAGTQYVTFKNMTLSKPGTSSGYYSSIFSSTGGASNNTVSNCWLLGNTNYPYSTGWYDGSGTDTGNLAINTRFSSFGYGFEFTGAYAGGNTIQGCQLDSYSYYAVYLSNQDHYRIIGNTFTHNRSTGNYDIYTNYCRNTVADNLGKVMGNYFLTTNYANWYDYGTSFSGSTKKILVANNMFINNGNTYGLYMYYPVMFNFYNNSFSSTTSTPSYLMYCYYDYSGNYTASASLSFKNNIWYRNNGGNLFYYYPYSSAYKASSDYNDFYAPSSGTWGTWAYSSVSSLSTMASASSGDAHSVNVDPGFLSSTDLHATASGINAKATPLSAVPADYDGQTRNATTPDIGADEFTPPANDAGIIAILNPSGAYCAGTTSIQAILKNSASNNLTSATIVYRVNGAVAGTYSWTGSVATAATTTITVGTYSFSSGTYKVSVHAFSPNGTTDDIPNNDSSITGNLNQGIGGTKTIAASGGDYSSFGAAITAIQSNGVCGNLLLQVSNGSYNEYLNIPSSLGSNATHTVTFQGNTSDSSKVVLWYSANVYVNNGYLIYNNGASNVTFKNMTLSRPGTSSGYYSSIMYSTGGASNNTISNCWLLGNTNYPYSTGWYDGGSSDTGNLAINSRFSSFGYGFEFTGSYAGGNTIQGCQLDSYSYYAVYLSNQDHYRVISNTFTHNRSTGNYDIYTSYCRNSVADNYGKIAGNYFLTTNYANWYDYGAAFATSPSKRILVANNMFINNGNTYGVYMNYPILYNFYYNSFSSTTSTPSYLMYCYYDYSGNYTASTSMDFKNNIWYRNNGGSLFYYYPYSSSYKATSDYNDFYAPSSGSWGSWAYSSPSSLSTMASASGGDAHSLNSNPGFVSSTDLHCTGNAMYQKGTPLSAVNNDYDKESRPGVTPCMGADEFTPPLNDASITAITNPSGAYCAGTTSIQATLKSLGINTMTSAVITYRVNGALAGTYTWSGSLTTGATTTVTVGTYSFASGSYVISVRAFSPNSTTDGNPNNDSVTTGSLNQGVSGTKTIKVSGGDYSSFSSAVTSITASGLCGALVLQVDNGSWNDAVTLSASFPSSATKPVTFQGNTTDSSKVVLWSTSTYPVSMTGAQYVTFKNMTISAKTSYNYDVYINGSSNNTIQSCYLTRNSAYYSGGAGVYSYNTSDTGNSIVNCRLTQSYYGVELYGASYGQQGWLIKGSTFDSLYYYDIWAYYNDHIQIIGNTFKYNQSGGGYNLYLYYCRNTAADNLMKINGNLFISNASTAMYCYGSDFAGGSSQKQVLVANNMLALNNSSNGTGLQVYYFEKWNFLYNSVSITNASTNYGFFLYDYSGDYFYSGTCTIKNNIFSNTSGSGNYALYYYQAYYGSTTYEATANYNDYYSTGSNVAYWNAGRSSLSALQSYSGQDVNSISINPSFTSTTNLHCTGSAMYQKGTPISFVTTDFDGQSRPGTTPCIGADEFTPPANDASISAVINPSGAYCTGSTTIQATLANLGTNTLTSAVITYRINGNLTGTYTWSGSIAASANTTVSVGTYSFTSGTYNVSVRSFSPNGTTDGNPNNDSTVTGTLNQGVGGTKTIKTSGGDYSSFSNAISAINTNGLCGSVLFQVDNGSWAGGITLGATFPSSATKTVTFQGNTSDSSKVVLSSSSTYPITFSGAKFVTFKNMTITASTSYNYDVYMYNGSSDNTFQSCWFTRNPSYYSGGAGVYDYNTSDTGNIFINSRFSQSYYGAEIYGSSYGQQGWRFQGCTFDSIYYYDIWAYYNDHIQIVGNTFKYMRSGSGYNVYLNYCRNTTADNLGQIVGNFFNSNANYGVYDYGSAFAGTSKMTLVANNMFALNNSSNSYGYQHYYGVYFHWYNNTFSATTTGTSYPLYCYDYSGCYSPAASMDFKNNIYSNTTTGALVYYYPACGYRGTSNYNDYYAPSSSSWGSWYGSSMSSLTSVQSATGGDANSLNVNPGFVSSSDLHCTGSALYQKGTALALVTTDIDGQSRPATPCIGADEFTPPANDAGITLITNPNGAYCAGTQNINATLKNFGTATLSIAVISYRVNGALIGTYTWGGTLASGATTSVTVGTYSFVSGTYNVSVASSLPNYVTDGNLSNDSSITGSLNLGVAGTRTIKTSGGDYTSFTNAITSITSSGLCGALTLQVDNGGWNESITLGSTFPASSLKPITFQGNTSDSSKVVLYSSSGTGVVNFTGANWVTFKNMTIKRTTGAHLTYFSSGSSNNTITNCWLLGNKTTYSSGYSNVYDGSSTDTGNTIANCRISSNYYGGNHANSYTPGWKYIGNTFDSIYYYGLYLYYQDHIQIIGNTFKNNLSGSGYNVYMYYCRNTAADNLEQIVGNFFNSNANYGVYDQYSVYAGSTRKILVANNMFALNNSSNSAGYYQYLGQGYNFYYNTFSATTSGTNYPLFIYDYSGYSISATTYNIKNNIFSNTGGGYAFYYQAVYGSSYAANSDYNDFYFTGTNMGYFNSTYTSLSGWQSGTSKDANSLNVNPGFVSTTDLHVTSSSLNAKATPIAIITTDIDGQARDVSTPDIGADEFTPPANDGSITLVTNPSGAYCAGTQNISATLFNAGSATMTSAVITYSVNSTLTGTYSWSGTLASGASTAVTVGTYSFVSGTYNVVVHTTLPNGVSDPNVSNDSATSGTLNLGISGTQTIKTSGGDYTSFSNAISTIVTNGLCGSLILQVDNGSWSDALTLSSSFPSTATKTVTFQGNTTDSSKVVLYNTSGYPIQFTGAKWVTFKNMTITRAGNSGTAVRTSGGSSNNTFQSCYILGASSYTSSGYQGISSGSASDTANSFLNCRISNWYYGAYLSNSYQSGWKFNGCQFDSIYNYGLYLYYQDHIQIVNNTFTNQLSGGGYNIYMYYCRNTAADNLGKIVGNFFNSGATYCIQNYYPAFAATTKKMLVANNMFAMSNSSNQYAYYGYYDMFLNFDYNSINATGGGSTYPVSIYDYSGYNSTSTTIFAYNNIFKNSSYYGVYYAQYYTGSTTNEATFNYNDYYTPSQTTIGVWNYSSYTFANWKAAGWDVNGKNIDPGFTSATDLHASNSTLRNGTPLAIVPTDFYGTTRNGTKPVMGADEFPPASLDASISAITNPVGAYCAGTQNIIATLNNNGSTTLTSVLINYRVNGALQGTYTWTGTLAFGSSTTVTVGTYSFSSGSVNISVGSTSPNGGTDADMTNDSTYVSGLNLGVAGTRTIKTSGGDYTSFSNAVSSITSSGLCGSLVLQVDNGSWSDAISLGSTFPSSATTTVTFQGNTSDSTKVILYNTSSVPVSFSGATYVTFKNMTITRASGSGNIVSLASSSNNNTFQSCYLRGNSGYTSSGYSCVYDYYTTDTANSFKNCRLSNNSYGAYLYGNSNGLKGATFQGCQFDSIYNYGIYAYYTDHIRVIGNTFTNQLSNSGANIYMYYSRNTAADNYMQIVGNIFSSSASVAIQDYYSGFAGSNKKMLIANNMFVMKNSSNQYAYYGNYSAYVNFYDNSIGYTGTTYSYPFYMYDYSPVAQGSDIRGNIFANTSGSNYALYYYQGYSSSYAAKLDYNDYYASSGNIGYFQGSSCSTLASWKTATGQDAHSVSANPGFVSTSDLHISSTNPCALHGKGVVLALVPNDIDGQSRGSSSDIGADQYFGSLPAGSWTGGVSTDWLTTGNWCSGTIPTSTDNVNITTGGNYPNIGSSDTTATCNNITVGTGAAITISGGMLTVNGQLTNNGTYTHSSGRLVTTYVPSSSATPIITGTGTFSYTGGSTNFAGTSDQVIPALTYWGLTTSGSGNRTLKASTVVQGPLVINTGTQLNIGANTLTMNGTLSGAGVLNGGSTSNLTIGGTGPNSTLPNITNGLNNLTINKANGVNLGSSQTIGGGLFILNGPFSIGANTLTLNGAVVKASSGSLIGGSTSNIIFGGSSANTTLPAVSGGLSVLTINRANGIKLSSSGVTVNDTLLLYNGVLDITTNSASISLPNASNIVRKNGSMNGAPTITGSGSTINLFYLSALTTGAELPSTVNNVNITISSGTVSLNSNLTVNGDFNLSGGTFAVGAHTLALGGNLNSTGVVTFGASSSLTLNDYTGSATQFTFPANLKNLNNFTLNRTNGAQTSGNVNVGGNLTMTLGNLTTTHVSSIDTVFLGSSASLTGESSTSSIIGRVQTTRTVTNSGSTNTMGGIGVDITIPSTGNSPGSTAVTRSTGTTATGSLSLSHYGARGTYTNINRVFKIKPTSNGGLNAGIVFHYLTTELNGVPEAGLDLYRKSDNATVFGWKGVNTRNSTTHTLTLNASNGKVDSFSSWTGGGFAAPLPVELMDFEAQLASATSTSLTWTTASELNNDHFDVERSEDGVNFMKVGEKQGHGTTQDVNHYSFLDPFGPGILSPVLYYRLKQLDYNGSASYSDVRKVVLSAKQDGVKVWFDRDIQKLKATITVSGDRQITLRIVDAQGRAIANQNIQASKGSNAVQLDMQGYANGVYTFIYTSDEGMQTTKFIKY